ncbi:MAG TPA: bifunctional 5,10-methylenetetrahydrofolate dehydrogenase/5,10-methenyltetrahydrofolate cyclohydrolase [Candidatus Paceibacterota bacterium]|nr:bifunctional 5,10-methylenetetrahydrofolate dehydrogenase/5,10-methenyltetrahydrofolate cyclohydrolase [Candidatus Paceibacterota bacterium]
MIVDGKKLAQDINEKLKEERKKISKKIRLAIVLVGNDPASLSFIKQKERVAKEIGIDIRIYQYEDSIKTKELRKKVGEICRVTYNRGVIVQLPLPPSINTQVVLNAILPKKDPDILCEKNLGSFYANRLQVLPPVLASIKFLLEKYKIDIEGKNVLIIGRGRLVGKPASLWFINQSATVIVANSKTKDLKEFISKADIIITSAGKPGLITGDLIKKEAVIFDAAVVSEKGKLKGDCDDSVKDKAGFITPVPGGIGPLCVAFLFKNLLELVKNQD